MAVAALLLWLATAAVGSYLLFTAVRSGPDEREPAEPATVLAETAPAPAEKPARVKDPFAPPSLRRAQSAPMPGLRELAEFAHPALAVIGVGVWLGYVVSRDRVFAAIGLGVLLGAICAGVSWFAANTRAARRARAAGAAGPGAAAGRAPLAASPRLLLLHAAGATLTLLFAVLIAVRA